MPDSIVVTFGETSYHYCVELPTSMRSVLLQLVRTILLSVRWLRGASILPQTGAVADLCICCACVSRSDFYQSYFSMHD